MQPVLVGALWIVGGMALIGFSDNLIPALSERMGLWQLQVVRAAMVVPLLALVVGLTAGLAALRVRSLRRVLERSALSVLALMLYFAALPAVGIAQAAAGLFTSPIWLVLIGGLVFGEGVGPRRIAAVVVGFVGVLLVLEVGQAPLRPMALVAVAAGLAYALGIIWTRQHCAGETSVALAMWQFLLFLGAGLAGLAALPLLVPLLAGVEGTGFATRGWAAMDAGDMGLVLVIGICGISASACLAVGYKAGPSSVMGLFDFSFLIWAPVFALAMRGETLSGGAMLGMGLIVAAGLLAVWSGKKQEAEG